MKRKGRKPPQILDWVYSTAVLESKCLGYHVVYNFIDIISVTQVSLRFGPVFRAMRHNTIVECM